MSTKISKKFFLLSFLPAAAYWYLEEAYPVRIALMAGLGLAFLEIALEYIFTREVHAISKFNFFLILALGGISLIGEDGIWFKLQPFFTGVLTSLYLAIKNLRGRSLLEEMSAGMGKVPLPGFLFKQLEWHLIVFLTLYGSWMLFVAIYMETGRWLFFKTAGFYIAFFVFMIVEMFWMRLTLKKHAEHEFKKKVLLANVHK